MTSERQVVEFLSRYLAIRHKHFPAHHRRAQWHIVCHLCVNKRDGVPVGEISGLIRQIFLLDEATVRDRLADLQAAGLCVMDPPDRAVSARTIVHPTADLMIRFDAHLFDLAKLLLASFGGFAAFGAGGPDLSLDQSRRQSLMHAIDVCNEIWLTAIDRVLYANHLTDARRMEAKRHLLSLSHWMLIHLATEHHYGGSADAEGGSGLLADAMAAALLGLTGQNFQTTRDHIAYLTRVNILERRTGRALRVALSPMVVEALHQAFGAMAAELLKITTLIEAEEKDLTKTIPLDAGQRAREMQHILIISRDGSELRQIVLSEEPVTVGRGPSCDRRVAGRWYFPQALQL